MTKEKTVEAFIKAIDIDYVDTFLKYGELCMSTSQWFRDYESRNPEVGDRFEGAVFAAERNITFSDAPSGHPELFETVIDDAENLTICCDSENENILSLYTIFGDQDIHHLPEKFINEFNHHKFYIITAPQLFISRIENEIKNEGYTPIRGLVKYETPNGKWNPLMKRKKYEYQNEARIFFKNPNNDRKTFRIGTTSDFIFEIFPQKQMCKISLNNGRELIIA